MDDALLERWAALGSGVPEIWRTRYEGWEGRVLPPPAAGGAAPAAAAAVPIYAKYHPEHWQGKRGGLHRPEHVDVGGAFDGAAFNFTKIKPAEVMFDVVEAEDGELALREPGGGEEGGAAGLLVVNVSPMFCGHSLLVPDVTACHPQVVTRGGLALAVQFMQRCRRRDSRLVYNSRGAFASINHLHFHYVCMEEQVGGRFPIEACPLTAVPWRGGGLLPVATVRGYPTHGIAMALPGVGGAPCAEYIDALYAVFDALRCKNVPYNALITPSHVYVCPRQNQSRNTGPYRVAVVEVLGCPVVTSAAEYEAITQERYAACLREEVRLEDAEYAALLTELFPQ